MSVRAARPSMISTNKGTAMLLYDVDPSLKQLAEEIGKALVEELWARLRKSDMPIAPEYLSPRQVSQLTGISVKTLEAWRGVRKELPYYKVGRGVRYRLKDIRDFVEGGGPIK